MYTDGCTEATNAAGLEFSQQKLAETVIAKRDSDARSILESVYQSVVEFHGSAVLEDDFTLVVLKVPKEDTSIASPTQPG